MEQRMTIITLGVSNLDTSTKFYEKQFGWKKAPASNENITFFLLNGIYLSLYPKDALAEDAQVNGSGQGFKTFTLAYNTRTEKEVDDLFAELERKGVEIIKPPEKVNWGGYSGYIADPDGNLWEIAYNPFLEMNKKGDIKI
jgi:hypothetical protein